MNEAVLARDAVLSGDWLAAALLVAVAGALFFRRSYPVALVAFVAVMEVAVTLRPAAIPTTSTC